MSGIGVGDIKLPCSIKRRNMGTRTERMASKIIHVLCVMFIVFYNGHAMTIGTFYRTRAPSYIEKVSNKSDIARRGITDHMQSLQIIQHEVPGQIFDVIKFNLSLQAMFQEWQYCSFGKFTVPNVVFLSTDGDYGCEPSVKQTQLEDNTFYMHIMMSPNCVDDNQEYQTIGKGELNGQQSWIFNTAVMYSNRLMAHELGHNFGLLHAARNDDEYGDFTCVMGMVESRLDLAYPTCFNAPHAFQLSWNNPEHIVTDGNYPVPKNDRFVYRINDVYFFQVIHDHGYFYLKKKDMSKGSDTTLLAILQPGLTKTKMENFELIFDKNVLHILNNTRSNDSPSYVQSIIFFSFGAGIMVTLLYFLWHN